jgi:hypothetical protein
MDYIMENMHLYYDDFKYKSITIDQIYKRENLLFFGSNKDKDIKELEWLIYGDPISKEIIVEYKYKDNYSLEAFAAPEGLVYPLMNDRIFGIDENDLVVAMNLCDRLYDKYKESFK